MPGQRRSAWAGRRARAARAASRRPRRPAAVTRSEQVGGADERHRRSRAARAPRRAAAWPTRARSTAALSAAATTSARSPTERDSSFHESSSSGRDLGPDRRLALHARPRPRAPARKRGTQVPSTRRCSGKPAPSEEVCRRPAPPPAPASPAAAAPTAAPPPPAPIGLAATTSAGIAVEGHGVAVGVAAKPAPRMRTRSPATPRAGSNDTHERHPPEVERERLRPPLRRRMPRRRGRLPGAPSTRRHLEAQARRARPTPRRAAEAAHGHGRPSAEAAPLQDHLVPRQGSRRVERDGREGHRATTNDTGFERPLAVSTVSATGPPRGAARHLHLEGAGGIEAAADRAVARTRPRCPRHRRRSACRSPSSSGPAPPGRLDRVDLRAR